MPLTAGIFIATPIAGQAYPISLVDYTTGHHLVKQLVIQPYYNNQGTGFVGTPTMTPLSTPPVGVYKQLPIPTPTTIPEFAIDEKDVPNGLDLFEFAVASSAGGSDGFVLYWNEQ